MIAERYLAKRFSQGKQEGIAEGEARAIARMLDMLDKDTRKEVERKLRRNDNPFICQTVPNIAAARKNRCYINLWKVFWQKPP